MKLKIVRDLPNWKYHERDKYLSSSMLKAALNGTVAYHNYLNKENKRSVDMDFGSCAHTVMLEPHKFDEEIVVYDENDRPDIGSTFRSKVNKGWKDKLYADAEENHQIVIEKDAIDEIYKMKEVALSNPKVKELLENNDPEISFYVEDWHVPELDYYFNIKVRPDILTSNVLADYKTFRNAPTPKKFKNEVVDRSYDLSMALYHDILMLFPAFKDVVLHCMWVVQNKSGSCDINFLSADKWLELGRSKYIKALGIIKAYNEGQTYTSMDDIPDDEYSMDFEPTQWDWDGFE